MGNTKLGDSSGQRNLLAGRNHLEDSQRTLLPRCGATAASLRRIRLQLGSPLRALSSLTIILTVCIVIFSSPSATAFTYVDVPVITRAADLVEESPTSISLGSSLQLTVKTTPSAQRFRAGDFQVRMFRLPGEYEKIPREWAIIDSCYIYLATVFKFRGSRDETINFGQFNDVGFLNINYDGIRNGRYLLVFEKLSDTGRIFRLHRDRMSDYFESGLYLEIRPTRKYRTEEATELAHRAAQRSDKRHEDITRNAPSLKCYRYKPVRLANDADVDLATLEVCVSLTSEGLSNTGIEIKQ